MPWIRKGKCVYKKNKDGTKGKKEGCSDSIEKAKDYLKALYANTDDAPKKENKKMKMKKSELMALLKEEIKEALTMMEDSYDHPRLAAEYPEIGEADKIVEMVMEMAGGDKVRAMEMLQNAIGSIQGAMDVEAEPMMEGIDPESAQLIGQAMQQLAPLVGVMSLPVLIGLIYEHLKGLGAK